MIHSSGNQSNNAIKRILILGAGMTAWTVAAGLANGLRGLNINIVVVDDERYREQDTYAEASTPSALAFHKLLGISEQDLIKKTGATYKLATRYQQWANSTQDYFLPFSAHGFMLNRIEFPHYALHQQARGKASAYDTFALSAVAAKLGRFQHPSRDESSLYSTLEYALHLPCEKYARYLQDYAQQSGVHYVCASLQQVVRCADNGHLESVLLENITTPTSLISQDGKLCADFFIDCSGNVAKLIGEELGISHIENDAVVTSSSISMILPTEEISPATQLSLAPAGWQLSIGVQQQTETRYFYNEEYSSPEQAVTWLLKNPALAFPLNNLSIANIKSYQHNPGKRKFPWHKNCIAIGESACNLEPFVIGKLHLAQSAALRLLSLFPATADYEFNCQEYNRLTDLECEHISDFNALHYKFSSGDSSFWQAANKCHLSERNQYRLALFKQRATIPFYENETVSTAMWASFLLGNSYIPKRYDPLVDGIDSDWINSQLDKMQKLILSAAQAMPTQSQYLKRLTVTH